MPVFEKGEYGDVKVNLKAAAKFGVGVVIGVLAIIIFLIMNPMVIVKAGTRAVVLEWGAVKKGALAEGIHWVTPIIQSVEKMDIRVQKLEMEASAASKDLQIVKTKITLNYQLNPSHVDWLYQNFAHDVELRLVAPAIQEYLKAATAKFTAEELITKREQVKDTFRDTLATCLQNSGVIAREVFITDFAFNSDFEKSIEEKVTAQQNALREKNVLEKKKYEAEQVVVTATAEAKAIQIKAQAITQTGGKDYVNLMAIQRWDGKLPQYMIPGGSLPFLTLDYNKK